jgi:hypothetical protein
MECITFRSGGSRGGNVKIPQGLKILKTRSKNSFIMIAIPLFLLFCTCFSLVHGKPADPAANRILAVFRDPQKEASQYSMFFEDLKGIFISLDMVVNEIPNQLMIIIEFRDEMGRRGSSIDDYMYLLVVRI